jgi:methylenetetrahydrofolate dehydrogenase (NADP+)/methenyltetrahydrofolate cyclohydrolase
LPASTTQAELLALIEKKNADPKIHGILVQLPLPKHIESRVVLEAVSPIRMPTGFTPTTSVGWSKASPVFEACTPKGVIKMIESTGVSIEGKRAVVARPQQYRRQTVGADVAPPQCHRHDLSFENKRPCGGLP